MRASPEVSIDLTAEELLEQLLSPPQFPAKAATAFDDTVEIELTAEQMDALLSAGSPPSRG